MRSQGRRSGVVKARAGRVRRATTWCVLGAFLGTLPGAPPALAAPEGERVVHGEASFERDGAATTITTGTRETIVDYDRFDIDVDERVRIDQPDARSRILNRVPYGDASRIDGGLSSNGVVYILNPSGVFLGDRAIVDVGGLVAGAGHLSNGDFLAGIDRFTELEGEVGLAEGASVRAARDVVLLGRRVENLGSILSEAGMIAIVAGENVVLAPLDGHVAVHVEGPSEPPGVEAGFAVTQAGSLEAQRVMLSAGDTYSLAMNHTGVTRAGEIHVDAGDAGLVQLAGTLDASNAAAGAEGGKIRVLAGKIAVLDASLDASGAAGGGEILVGGDVRGGGELPTARRLYVGPQAELRADATQVGVGGKIVLYASERTAFQGELSARGGAQGGDGGFAEISGAQLESRGKVDLGAPAGRAGTLLYDPDEIEIAGGLADGTDTPDASDTTIFGNSVGEVLSGDVGTGAEPFVIYESEIEGTDANIILEAVNRIFASGDFTNIARGEGVGVVALVPGRSLTLRTTRTVAPTTPTELGIDLVTQAVQGEALEWRVSQGGRIALDTNLAVLSTVPPEGAPKASIQAGVLVADGLAYIAGPTPDDLMTPDLTEFIPGAQLDAIAVTTERGDIDVARIVADGEDAVLGRTASPGRRIQVATQQGDLVVDAISAVGGSATEEQATRGEVGGIVLVEAVGNATIGAGGVDVSGGDGLAGASFGGTPLLDGGGGGLVLASAEGQGTLLLVQGNLTATGGDGVGSFEFTPPVAEGEDPEDPVTIEADGGQGGSISLAAENNLTIATADPGDPLATPVEIVASGGDGSGSGGSAVAGGSSWAISIVGGPELNTPGDVRVNAVLTANGGDARQAFGGATPGVGGRGGSGGNVTVSANGGKLLAASMQIVANGGVGEVGVDAMGEPLEDDQGFVVGSGGGATGVISLGGTGEVVVGRVEARGGAGINAGAGLGASVGIDSVESSVTLAGDIDVDGGDATLDGATGVAVEGGRAGSITVRAPKKEEDEGDGVGHVFLRSVVGGRGGSGRALDEMGNPTLLTLAQGASIDVEAAGDLEVGVEPPPAGPVRFEGSSVDLLARNIGAGSGGPIPIAGTGEATDSAELVANGTLRADLDPAAARSFGRVDMQVTSTEGHAELTRGGVDIAASTAATATTLHTLTKLGRDEDDDPLLSYRLNATVAGGAPQPVLRVEQNAVRLGTAGGEIVNGGFGTTDEPVAENRGAIEGAAGAGTHATTRGDLGFEGSTLGTAAAPLLLDGDAGGALRLDAKGDVHANLVDADSASFGAIDIVQRATDGDVTMDLRGTDAVSIVAEGTATAPESRVVLADTTGSGSAFAYKVDAGTANTLLEIDRVRLGGRGLLSTTGDLVLTAAAGTDPVIATGGHDLSLISRGGAIRQESASVVTLDFTGSGDAGDEDPARLAFRADSSVGSATAPLRTRGLQGVAGTSFDGGVFLVNAGVPGAEDLRIERVTNLDPADLDETLSGAVSEAGLRALNGNLEITHQDPGGRIVLGRLRDVAEFSDLHADASGNVVLSGPIEIENARFLRTLVPRLDEDGEQEEDEDGNPIFDTVFLRHNDASIRSATGDVVLNGSVNTGAGSTATSQDEDAPADEFVHASLGTEAGGTVRFLGDVGKRDDEAAPLALLDTTRASVEGERSFEVGDALFRGTLDGPGGAAIEARDLSTSETDHEASVDIDGDVGGAQVLTGLAIDAERIRFTATDRVVTGTGGIRLDTHQTTVPQVATLSDVSGGVRFVTAGAFRTGDLDKLSVAGPLQIQAASARFTDLSATRISVDAPTILIAARAPGLVEQRDGSTGMDGGTDIVADQIALSSVPTVDPATTGATPTFGLGSGGISAPGSLAAFDVVRFTAGVGGVDRELFFGIDGRILDLTPTGNRVVGNPSQDIPRERPETVPALPPRFTQEAPAAPPAVDAEQVLAFLRCGAPGALTSCDAQSVAPLAGLHDFGASTLASERGADLAARYRALRSRDLSAAFDAAGAGFRGASGFGEFDAVAFGSYLEASREHEPARTAIRELAVLLVEIDLLGLAPEVEAQVRHALASELAYEADLPGFDAQAVLAAVAATPIGLPPQ